MNLDFRNVRLKFITDFGEIHGKGKNCVSFLIASVKMMSL